MLTILGEKGSYCDGVSRREFLRIGGLALGGLSMADVLRAEAATGKRLGHKAIIMVYLPGGPPHQDMVDLKPDAPAEIRGDFKPVSTKVPGIQISEHLPNFAQRMDRLAVVRSMTHKNNGHLPATHWILTGKAIPNLPIDAGADKIRSRTDWPSYGSALNYFLPRTDGVPNAVNLPTYLQEGPLLWPGQYAGCLGPKYDPWQITDDPNKKGFQVQNLSLPAGFSLDRLKTRRSLLDCVNRQQDRLGKVAESEALTDQQKAAFRLLTANGFGEAFRMEQETEATRDRYGRHMFGQSLLLARRLVEAGVPIVQANMGIVQTWDSHSDLWNHCKNALFPPMDKAVGALLDDLKERGLADDVLVVVTGEFGRAPKITTLAGQTTQGRDHWAHCFSTVFSGAGVRGGQVIGASDATGAFPATQGFTPDDLGATVYSLFGIDPESQFIDRDGRPVTLCTGTFMEPLFTGAGV